MDHPAGSLTLPATSIGVRRPCHSGCLLCEAHLEAIEALPSWWELDEGRLPHRATAEGRLGGAEQSGCPLCDLLRWLGGRKANKALRSSGVDPLPMDRIVAGVDLATGRAGRQLTLLAAHLPLDGGEVMSYIGRYKGHLVAEALSCRHLLDLLDVVGLNAPVGIGGFLPDLFRSHNRLVVSRGQLAGRDLAGTGDDEALSHVTGSVYREAKGLSELLAETRQGVGTEERQAVLCRHSEHVVAAFASPTAVNFGVRGAHVALASFGLQAHWTVLYAEAGAATKVDPRMLQRLQGLALDGSGWLVETYPAMSRLQWGIGERGIGAAAGRPGRPEEVGGSPGEVGPIPVHDALAGLLKGFSEASGSFGDGSPCSDAHDSTLAALTAAAAKVGLTLLPRSRDDLVARLEGWIHFPVATSVRDGDEGSRIERNRELQGDPGRWERLQLELVDALRISLSGWEAQRVSLL